MCSLLLTTMAVPCGFVSNCQHELVCSNNPTCCLHRFYNHVTLYSYGSENQMFSNQQHQPSPPVPSNPLPDLVTSSRPSLRAPSDANITPDLPTSASSISASTTQSQTKPKNKHNPRLLSTSVSSYWASQRTKHLTRKRNLPRKVRSRGDPCPASRPDMYPRAREMCLPCSNTVAESIRHILEIQNKFPDNSLPSRRLEFSLSWNVDYEYDHDCVDCNALDGCRDYSTEENWMKVGKDLRKIADDFKLSSCKRSNEKTLHIDTASLLNFVTRTFFLSFVGILAFRLFSKLR